MSKFHLIRYTPFPPGEFPYSQVVNGKIYSFSGDGLDIQNQAFKVAKFRKANGLERATAQECVEDIDCYTCQRLGNDPNYCTDGTVSASRQQVQSSGCRTCGMKV